MKLYNLDNSPFAARVRIQIRQKNLPVEILEPPIPLRTTDFKKSYPLGKLPILELPDGSSISESTVIIDYLEALYPDPPLLPEGALEKAQNGMLIRYTDNHLSQALSPLFADFISRFSGEGSNSTKLNRLKDEIEKLNLLLIELPPFQNRGMQTADICLATHIFYAEEMARWFGDNQLTDTFPNVAEWQQWVKAYQAVSETLAEMAKAHEDFIKHLEASAP